MIFIIFQVFFYELLLKFFKIKIENNCIKFLQWPLKG